MSHCVFSLPISYFVGQEQALAPTNRRIAFSYFVGQGQARAPTNRRIAFSYFVGQGQARAPTNRRIAISYFRLHISHFRLLTFNLSIPETNTFWDYRP